MERLLKVENLKTRFVTWNGVVKALDGVTFEIKQGEVLGMVGETGSGKSVTALSIMNLIPETQGAVTDGDILFRDTNLTEKQKSAVRIREGKNTPKIKVKRRLLKQNFKQMNQIRGNSISMIFQEPMSTLNPIMSVGKQIEDSLYAHQINYLALRIIARKKITSEQSNEIIENTIDRRDPDYLDHFVEKYPDLFAIRDQVEFVLDRTDITSYRKRLMLQALRDNDSAISARLQRMSVKKFRRAPRIIPRLIREEARNLIVELLTEVNIPEPAKVVNQFPHELSGGMRQRVVIAIAISSNPSLLIADEPTTALDVTIQAQILDILRKLNKSWRTSILFITHDLGVISEISDRVAVMYAGSVVEVARTSDLFESPKHPYTQGLMTSIPSYGGGKLRLKSIPGTVPNLINPPSGCKFNPRCQYVMDICKSNVPEMTDMGGEHSVSCWLFSRGEK